MSSFYGNMKNNSRASFIFDRVYSSRSEMEDALMTRNAQDSTIIEGDGVFVNRYVLVNYEYTLNETDPNLIARYDPMYQKLESGSEKRRSINSLNYSGYYVKRDNEYIKAGDLPIESRRYDPTETYYERKVYIDKYRPTFKTDEYQVAALNATLWQPGIYYIENSNGEFQIDQGTSFDSSKIYYKQLLVSGGPTEDTIYHQHKMADWERYHQVYDRTVWMKIYIDSQERYILVAELDAKAPKLSVIADSPDCKFNEPHFDMRASNEYEYLYHTPKNWSFFINDSTPATRNSYKLNTNATAYFYYEMNITTATNRSYNTNVEYPYFNIKGFDKLIQSHVPVNTTNAITKEGIFLKKTKSGTFYPQHEFRHVYLTEDTYWPNRYYIVNPSATKTQRISSTEPFCIDYAYYIKTGNNTYKYVPLRLSSSGQEYEPVGYDTSATYYYDDVTKLENFKKDTAPVDYSGDSGEYVNTFSSTAVYYDLTWKTQDSKRVIARENDTQRLDIYLPSIGNTMSDIWDVIYGAPRKEGNKTLLGYTCSTTFNGYSLTSSTTKKYTCSNGIDGTAPFYLSFEEIDALYPEIYPGIYDIPVFVTSSNGINMRPYTDNKMMRGLVPPYNNISEDVSLGWGITSLKRYISELRKLAKSDTLQTDWAIGDEDAFGFIHNKPKLILSYVLTKDVNIYDTSKKYYQLQKFQTNSTTQTFTIKVNNQTIGTPFVRGNSQNLYDEIFFVPCTGQDLLNKNITNPNQFGFYELPTIEDDNFYDTIFTYTKLSSTATYDSTGNTIYYELVNNEYQVAKSINEHYSLINTPNNLLEAPGGMSIQGYTVVVGNNNTITERRYKINQSSLTDHTYLFYGNTALKDFYLIFKNGTYLNNSTNDPTSIINYNTTRINLYNKNNSANSILIINSPIIEPLENSSWNSSLSSAINDYTQPGLYYATENCVTEQTFLTGNDFSVKKGAGLLYTLETSRQQVDADNYEIHNIWLNVKNMSQNRLGTSD